jgi:hypothetical protein
MQVLQEYVGLHKILVVARGKIFKRAEDILRVEEVKVNLVGLRVVVGCKRKNQTEKLVSLAMVVGSE